MNDDNQKKVSDTGMEDKEEFAAGNDPKSTELSEKGSEDLQQKQQQESYQEYGEKGGKSESDESKEEKNYQDLWGED